MATRWIARCMTVLAVLLAADWGGCQWLQWRMRAAQAQWRDTVQAQGWQVTTGPTTAGGFPFGATLTVADLTVSGGQALVPGGLDWHAQRLLLSLSLLHPATLEAQAEGQQTLSVTGGQTVLLNADQFLAEIPLANRPAALRVAAAGLTAGLRGSNNPQDVRIDGAQLDLALAGGGAARTSLRADLAARGVSLPDNGRWPLGATISRLQTSVSLASPALSGHAPAEQARAWKDWGGTLDVASLAVKWGPLDMTATFRLGLDDHLQPSGRGHAELRGWRATLDALANGGTLPDGVAETAKAVLGLTAPADAPLAMPVSLKDSTLSLGSIPLLRVRPVLWGAV